MRNIAAGRFHGYRGPEGGTQYIRETIRVLEELDLSGEDRRRIYQDNALRLLKLTGISRH